MVDIGFFEYIKNYYRKRYPNSYQKELGSFLESIIKLGRDNNEISWFATLIEKNTDYLILTACAEAIQRMKSKYQDLNSKVDEPFKKLKMNVQDILRLLRKLFAKKIKEYERMGREILQVRVRDYIIDIMPSMFMDISGLNFLEIVRREAIAIKMALERQMDSVHETEVTFEDSSAILRNHQDFYNFNDIMGKQQLSLPKGYT